ncbi:MAG: membrane dipeptidase [Candidatus Heimdallarchaeota archaeon]|nr:membrane dipeptidase [Candidatus Heimdallarchaeota archaeon]
MEDFVEHAKYIKSLVGSSHIAIGTDINALPGIMTNFEYLRDFSNLKNIFQNYGFNENEAEGISGENFVKMLNKH